VNPCPNDPPCGHYWHDIYEPGDPYPTCCVEGCRCGHPGDADVVRHADGTIAVQRADPVIRVSRELLDQMAVDASPHWDPDTMVLVLDTAGQYRYQYLRPESDMLIFGRIRE
jgi:hypothetical protein